MQRNNSMKYFKNTEAAAIYKVSEKSVRNWIAAAITGKNKLELLDHNGRHYIANTAKNDVVMSELAAHGQRYRNMLSRKIVVPRLEFYSTYTDSQVLNIFSNLDIHREIPLQYTYFEDGATHFDLYNKRLLNERTMNTLNATEDLMVSNFQMIDYLLRDFDRINIVDLGVGNAYAVRSLLEHLIQKEKLGKYVGVDISQEMLDIAESNIKNWFGDSVPVENQVSDLNYDRFGHFLANNPFIDEKSVNIVLMLGGTLSNMRQPTRVLRLINDSMGKDDILIHSAKLDSLRSRRYFNFDATSQSKKLDRIFGTAIHLLNIDEVDYETQQLYDEQQKCRLVKIILNYDVDLNLQVYGKERFIHFKKGESIVLFRAYHWKTRDVLDRFEAADFDLLNISKTFNQEFILTISKIKNEIPIPV